MIKKWYNAVGGISVIKSRMTHFLKWEINKAKELFQSGKTIHEIGKELKWSYNDVLVALAYSKIKLSDKHLLRYDISSKRFIFLTGASIGDPQTENLDNIRSIYCYAVEHNISKLIVVGNLLGAGNLSADEKVERIISHYPSFNGLTTFLLGGANEYNAFAGTASPLRKLTKERPDIKYLGVSQAYVRCGTLNVLLTNDIPQYSLRIPTPKGLPGEGIITLEGGHNFYKMNGRRTIYLPTPSDAQYRPGDKPGFVEVIQRDNHAIVSPHILTDGKIKSKREFVLQPIEPYQRKKY